MKKKKIIGKSIYAKNQRIRLFSPLGIISFHVTSNDININIVQYNNCIVQHRLDYSSCRGKFSTFRVSVTCFRWCNGDLQTGRITSLLKYKSIARRVSDPGSRKRDDITSSTVCPTFFFPFSGRLLLRGRSFINNLTLVRLIRHLLRQIITYTWIYSFVITCHGRLTRYNGDNQSTWYPSYPIFNPWKFSRSPPATIPFRYVSLTFTVLSFLNTLTNIHVRLFSCTFGRLFHNLLYIEMKYFKLSNFLSM